MWHTYIRINACGKKFLWDGKNEPKSMATNHISIHLMVLFFCLFI